MARRRRVTDVQRRRRVAPLLERWRQRLQLNHWSVVYRFSSALEHDGRPIFAEVNVTHPYKRAFMQFSRDCVDAAPAQELEHGVVHELCHLMLTDIKQKAIDNFGDGAIGDDFHQLIETATDSIALAALTLWYRKPWAPYVDQNIIGGGKI